MSMTRSKEDHRNASIPDARAPQFRHSSPIYRKLTGYTAALVVIGTALGQSIVPSGVAVADPAPNSDGPLILGTLLNTGDSDVRVVAQAWPPNEYLEKQEPGKTIRLIDLGTAYIDENGTFMIWADPQLDKSTYVGTDGYVNAELTISNGSTSATVPISVESTQFRDIRNVVDLAHSAQPVAQMTLESPQTNASSFERVVVNDAVTFTEESTVNIDISILTPLSANVCAPDGLTTGLRTLVQEKQDWDVVGQSFSNTSVVDATWTFTKNQTSSMGITGKAANGTLYANMGVTTVTSAQSVTGFPKGVGVGNHFYKTKFKIQEWNVQCERTGPGSPVLWYAKEYRPVGVYGGATAPTTTNLANAHHCAPYDQDGSEAITGGTAIKWTNGLSLSVYGISIGASTQTGYSTKGKIHYEMTRGSGWLCGNNDGPATLTNAVVSAAKTSAGY